MTAEVCTLHPDNAVRYVCDGCQAKLCDDCVDEGHALLFCKRCGERAMPVDGDAAGATVKVRRQVQARDQPYLLRQAFLYPLRGNGIYLYAATLGTLLVLWLLKRLPFLIGLIGSLFSLFFWLVLAGLVLRIVRSTAAGDNELPDWPDINEFEERVKDLLTWLAVGLLPALALMPVLFSLGIEDIFAAPRFSFWLTVTGSLWIGSAFGVMAFGAAGVFSRRKVFSLHRHVQAFLATGSDAIVITNMVFGVGMIVVALRIFLAVMVPLLGGALSSTLGAYWLLVVPHLSGVLFRRHTPIMEAIYWRH